MRLLLALLAAAIGCSPRDRRTPDDTLVVVIEASMASSDPRYAISNYDGKLSRLVHTGLTAVDTESLAPRLELASKVERAGDLAWDVEIRPDAKFSDGMPVTADEVAYTYESMLAKDSDSLFHRGFTERFTHVEALGPRTVRFHLRESLATFRTDIEIGIISRAGKGAGPYIVRELTSSHALLDLNPYYYGTKPKVPHVEIKFVRDASARLLMMVGGSADLIQNGVRLDLVEEVKDRPRVRVTSAPSVLLTQLLLNNSDPLLKDVRVRQAIALAIDRPAIIAAKFGGRARLATGLVAPGHWAYEPDVPVWNHDVARAKQLLDEAGLSDPDGAGPAPRARLVYKTSSDAFRVTLARVIAAQLAEVGLEVEVRSFEFATFFVDIKRGSYQLATIQTTDITDPDFYYTYLHSSRIPDPTNPDGGNRVRYRNARVDELTSAGRHELDQAKRKAMYSEVQRLVATEVPMVPLWHEDNVVLSNVDVQGYAITPNARLIGLASAWKRP